RCADDPVDCARAGARVAVRVRARRGRCGAAGGRHRGAYRQPGAGVVRASARRHRHHDRAAAAACRGSGRRADRRRHEHHGGGVDLGFGPRAVSRRRARACRALRPAPMTAPELCIRRPVLTLAAAFLIVLAGAIGIVRLPVREYPAVDPPTLTVTTTYPGASAEVVEAQITEPLEAAINTVAGIRALRSTSREGASQI